MHNQTLATRGKYTLTLVTRPNGTSFYCLDDEWRCDYPIHYKHTNRVAYDNPEYFPKRIIQWCTREVIKHAANR